MLSQSDFRKLVAKGEKEEKKPKPKAKPVVDTEAQERRREKRKRSYQEYLKRKAKYTKKTEEKSNYRDRAKERQQGKNLDYEETEEALKNISAEHSKVRLCVPCWWPAHVYSRSPSVIRLFGSF